MPTTPQPDGFHDRNARYADLVACTNAALIVDLSNLATRTDLAEMKAELLKCMVGTIGVQTIVILGAVVKLAKVVAH